MTDRPISRDRAIRINRVILINKDGKQDVLMHHPSTSEPHQVTTLIAR